MKTIALVACVSEKRNVALPAGTLYVSDWFLKASAYARQVGDLWFILSAKYGLLPPERVIEPYNTTLKDLPAAFRREWAERVLQGLTPILSPGDRVIFLAGKAYRQYLVDPIVQLGGRVSIPMEGLRIGEQMQWLNQHLTGM